MKVLNKIAVATLILGVMATPAMADGFYGALDFGQAKGKDACTGAGALGVVGCKDTSSAYRIGGGYQFTPMWGAEISYGDYGSASLGSFMGTPLGDWEISGIQISGTGTFPLGAGFDLIGKLGIARTKVELTYSPAIGGGSDSDTSTKLAAGIGAQYNVSQNVAIRAQYEDLGKVGDDATTGTSKVTLLTAGVVFKF